MQDLLKKQGNRTKIIICSKATLRAFHNKLWCGCPEKSIRFEENCWKGVFEKGLLDMFFSLL